MGSRQHQMSARVITSDVAWHGMAWLGVGFEGSRDCLASKQCPILKVSSMKKRLFSSETFDAVIPTLFPRDIDETIRELVEKITDRLKEMIRGEVRVVLRANARVTT